MNCKPGNLAIVVGGLDPQCPPLIGAIVRVSFVHPAFPDSWMLDPPVTDPRDGFGVVVMDQHLRPICDPGDDAKDEMLRPLPEEVAA